MNFEDIEKQMPELIGEMMVDLRISGCDSIREFFVVNRSNEPNHGGTPRFTYCEDEHADLVRKINILTDLGCIVSVRSEPAPTYRMTEEFANQLLDGWPEYRWPWDKQSARMPWSDFITNSREEREDDMDYTQQTAEEEIAARVKQHGKSRQEIIDELIRGAEAGIEHAKKDIAREQRLAGLEQQKLIILKQIKDKEKSQQSRQSGDVGG
jgi:hypothetical protein